MTRKTYPNTSYLQALSILIRSQILTALIASLFIIVIMIIFRVNTFNISFISAAQYAGSLTVSLIIVGYIICIPATIIASFVTRDLLREGYTSKKDWIKKYALIGSSPCFIIWFAAPLLIPASILAGYFAHRSAMKYFQAYKHTEDRTSSNTQSHT